MPTLSSPSLGQIKIFRDNPTLGDSAIPPEEIPLGINYEDTLPITDGGTKIGSVTLKASAGASVAVVNDAKDANHGGLFDFGEEKGPGKDAMPDLGPPKGFPAERGALNEKSPSNGKTETRNRSSPLPVNIPPFPNKSWTQICLPSIGRACSRRSVCPSCFRSYPAFFHRGSIGAVEDGPHQTGADKAAGTCSSGIVRDGR